jgi:predicted O-methyltransferase YrrM
MYKEESVTRKSNLELQDSLSAYNQHTAQQNHFAYKIFYEFIETVKPSRILEIGTAMGGFTMFLKEACDDLELDTVIRSYDIHGRHSYQTIIDAGVDVRVENVFNGDYTSVSQDVIDFIKEPGVNIVLCDGGYKIGEFNLLADYVKSGDFILAHDYARDGEYFSENINMKYWNWHEIQDSHIDEACERNELIPYKQDEFDTCVWVCKVKK